MSSAQKVPSVQKEIVVTAFGGVERMETRPTAPLIPKAGEVVIRLAQHWHEPG